MTLREPVHGRALSATGATVTASRPPPQPRAADSLAVDAGNPGWASAAIMARRLHEAGPPTGPQILAQRLHHLTTAENTAYGNAVNSELGPEVAYKMISCTI